MADERPKEAPPKSTPVGAPIPPTILDLIAPPQGLFGIPNTLMSTFLANQGMQGPVQLQNQGGMMGGPMGFLPSLMAPGVMPRSVRPAMLDQMNIINQPQQGGPNPNFMERLFVQMGGSGSSFKGNFMGGVSIRDSLAKWREELLLRGTRAS